jgi:hypothetical protein
VLFFINSLIYNCFIEFLFKGTSHVVHPRCCPPLMGKMVGKQKDVCPPYLAPRRTFTKHENQSNQHHLSIVRRFASIQAFRNESLGTRTEGIPKWNLGTRKMKFGNEERDITRFFKIPTLPSLVIR